jgi:hypothetical protein
MKPRIHGVLTPWIPGFIASGRRLAGVRQQVDRHDQHWLDGIAVQPRERGICA